MGRARSRKDMPVYAAERRLAVRLRHAIGLRQTYEIAGVRYRELSTERLKHALSKQGKGVKAFDVTFRAGPVMRIEATAQRLFADLSGPRLLGVYQRVESVLRPGMRALILGAGTGYAAEWVASRVAPSGAVVALDQDEQSVLYAQRRYAEPGISFEVGGIEALAGETDGAFDAAIAVGAAREGEDATGILSELWRVVSPAGWLMVACPVRGGVRDAGDAQCMNGESLVAELGRVTSTIPAVMGTERRPTQPPTISTVGDERDGWAVAIALKPFEE